MGSRGLGACQIEVIEAERSCKIQHKSKVSAIFKALAQRKETLCIAESCTGGLISSFFTDVSGASQYFLGSLVAYTYPVKTDLLKTPKMLLEQKGAVNAETAQFMSRGVKALLHGDWAVSITGTLEPGQVFIGVLGPEDPKPFIKTALIGSDTREKVKQQAALLSLDFLLSKLTQQQRGIK